MKHSSGGQRGISVGGKPSGRGAHGNSSKSTPKMSGSGGKASLKDAHTHQANIGTRSPTRAPTSTKSS